MWTRGYLRGGHLSTMGQEGPPSRATRCYLLTKWIWLSHITIAIHWHYFAIHHKSTKCPPEWALILPLLPYAFAIFNVSIVIKCHLILLHCCPMILHFLMLSWNVCLKGLLFFKMFPLPHCHQISALGGPCSSKQPAPRVFPLQVGQRVRCPESKVTNESDVWERKYKN